MPVESDNAHELAAIAGEIGADVLKRALRYPSDTGGWQLGDLDLSEHLDRYRNQKVVLIIAPVGRASDPTYTCGICGFVMNELYSQASCRIVARSSCAAEASPYSV